MATVGAMSVDMFMNNKHYLAGVSAATSATKRMESEISSSIAKINAKQMKSVTNNLLGNFGVVGMFQAGANMATELVKGFNSESIKGFGDAMSVLGNTLVSAIKALPIAGAFLQLGEEIGKSVFGDAQKEIDKTILAMQKLDAAMKIIQAPNITINSTLAAMQSKVTNFGESDKEKERRLFIEDIKNKQDAANKQESIQRLGNMPQQFTIEKRQVALQKGGTREVETIIQNLEYEKQIVEYTARQAVIQKEIADKGKDKINDATIAFDKAAAELQVLEDQKKLNEEMAQLFKDIAEAKKKAAADAAKALAEQIKQEKNLAREQLKQQKANAFNEAIDAYEALTAAENEYDAKVEKIKKDSGNLAGSVGLNTAIGTVKVAAVVDFGVQKQIDLAAQMLKEAKENNEYMQSINASVRAIASIP
tara:strand:+ start:2425 stop:3687 length:1263 start_codon:yes stop_codon:yes gene_type:complete